MELGGQVPNQQKPLHIPVGAPALEPSLGVVAEVAAAAWHLALVDVLAGLVVVRERVPGVARTPGAVRGFLAFVRAAAVVAEAGRRAQVSFVHQISAILDAVAHARPRDTLAGEAARVLFAVENWKQTSKMYY